MELSYTHSIFEYNSDTLQYLRKLYGLDNPERLEEAIDILVKWLQKQDHLIKKDYSKEYLERCIILGKGSVERVKAKLDKVSTFKTLLPNYFEPFDVKNCTILKTIFCAFLPKMTTDHDRVYIIKNIGDYYPEIFNIYKYNIMICELLHAYDYCNSIIAMFDARDCNMLDLIKAINLVDMRQSLSIIMEGYKLRIKGIHFLTTSKTIDTLIAIFKQALSPKLAERIHVHRDVETIYKHVPKEILPKDFGGNEKSIKDLSDDLKDAISSKEFTEYFNEMKSARTNENYRSDDKFNDQCMGMPGSFRKLTVD